MKFKRSIGESYGFFLGAETNANSDGLGERGRGEGIGKGEANVGNCRMREGASCKFCMFRNYVNVVESLEIRPMLVR